MYAGMYKLTHFKSETFTFPLFRFTELNTFLSMHFFHTGHIFKRIIWIATVRIKKLLLNGNS